MGRCRIRMTSSWGHHLTGRNNGLLVVFWRNAAVKFCSDRCTASLVAAGHICITNMSDCRNQSDNNTAQKDNKTSKELSPELFFATSTRQKATKPIYKVLEISGPVSSSGPFSTYADALTIRPGAAWPQQIWNNKQRVERDIINSHCSITLPLRVYTNRCGHADQTQRGS